MTESNYQAEDHALKQRAGALGRRFQQSMARVLDALAAQKVRDQKSLQRVLGLTQPAVSRLLSAVRNPDPLAGLIGLPGQEVLAQLLKGLLTTTLEREAIEAVQHAVAELDDLIYVQIGDRAAFDAILGEWVPDARTTLEARHRAAAFKAMSVLKGVQVDTNLNCFVFFPLDATHHAAIETVVLLGCRRLKPSGVLRIRTQVIALPGLPVTETTLQGKAVTMLEHMLLPRFSTISPGQLQTSHHADYSDTSVAGLPLQRTSGSGAELATAHVIQGVRVKRGTGPAKASAGGFAEPPSETYIVDVWLHDDVWPGVQPEPEIYDTVVRGVAAFDDPSRHSDRENQLETIEALGRGPSAMRVAEYPRYLELLAHVCDGVPVDLARLRGFRLRVRQPIYGSQISMTFTLPR